MALLFVTGGNGFIGSAVIDAARAEGLRVRALCRSQNISSAEHVDWRRGDLLEPASWTAAIEGADAVVHLAALNTGTASELRRVNVDGTRQIVDAAERANVSRLVHISSTTVTDGDEDPYGASKREAEDIVRESSVPWVILRPTLVVGTGEKTHLPRLVQRMRASRVLPVVGRFLVQPVFSEDVARAAVAATIRSSALGKTFELAGPEPISYDTFLRDVAIAAGLAPPRLVHLDVALLRAVAPLLDWLSGGHRYRRRVHASSRDHIYDIASARRELGFDPEPWREGIARRRLRVS